MQNRHVIVAGAAGLLGSCAMLMSVQAERPDHRIPTQASPRSAEAIVHKHAPAEQARHAVRRNADEPATPAVYGPDGRLRSIQPKQERPRSMLLSGSNAEPPYGDEPNWEYTDTLRVSSLQLADINDNGLLDLVVGCYHSSDSQNPDVILNTLVFFNTGNELESTPSWMSDDAVSTTSVRVGDISRNGFLDILAVNGGTAQAGGGSVFHDSVIYLNDGGVLNPAPAFSFSMAADGVWSLDATLIDLNDDDTVNWIVFANQGDPTASLNPADALRPLYAYRNNSPTGNTDIDIEAQPDWVSNIASIHTAIDHGDVLGITEPDAGDIGGGADPVLIVSQWIGSQSSAYRYRPGPDTFESAPNWQSGDAGPDQGVALADVDGDGQIDEVILGATPTRQNLNNSASGMVDLQASGWTQSEPRFGREGLLFADVTGDGQPDVIEVYSDGLVRIYGRDEMGNLATKPLWSWEGSAEFTTAIAVGDINGNGSLDLVVGQSGAPGIVVFYGPTTCPWDLDGDGSVGLTDLLELIGNWGPNPGHPADFDGDGSVGLTDLLELIGNWGPCP